MGGRGGGREDPPPEGGLSKRKRGPAEERVCSQLFSQQEAFQIKEGSALLCTIREKNGKVGFMVVRMKEKSSSELEKNQLMLINRNEASGYFQYNRYMKIQVNYHNSGSCLISHKTGAGNEVH